MSVSGKVSRASAALLCAQFLIVVFRAKTQSLTVDEARTFFLYVDRPLSEMATHFDACNHVLHTLLTKFFRHWLGYSELVLRLPSLLGCSLYFTAVLRLTKDLFGERPLQFAAVAALTLNPIVLDYCVASRGYGLALGIFFWMAYFVLRAIREDGPPRLLGYAGVLSGLTVGANLTFAVPVAAIFFVLLACALRQGFWRRLDKAFAPAIVVAFVLLVLPLARLEAGAFYVGFGSWQESLFDYLRGSFGYSPLRSPGVPPPSVLVVVFALLAALSGLASFRILSGRKEALAVALFGGVLALSVAALTVLHVVYGVPYPATRTGLYLIPLCTLALALSFDWLPSRPAAAWGTALLGALALLYVVQIDVRYFAQWRTESATKAMMARLDDDFRARHLTRPVALGASWTVEASANFYRKRRRMAWLPPVKRDSNLAVEPFEYFLLLGPDVALVDRLKLKVLFTDRLSGAVLASRT